VSDAAEKLGDWLERELAGAPQELAVRVRTSLPSAWRDATLLEAPMLLANAAAAELAGLLERGCETRRAAPALLTVDALVTYACQALALSGADIEGGTLAILECVAVTLPTRAPAA
jgi:hypothetical protein